MFLPQHFFQISHDNHHWDLPSHTIFWWPWHCLKVTLNQEGQFEEEKKFIIFWSGRVHTWYCCYIHALGHAEDAFCNFGMCVIVGYSCWRWSRWLKLCTLTAITTELYTSIPVPRSDRHHHWALHFFTSSKVIQMLERSKWKQMKNHQHLTPHPYPPAPAWLSWTW